MNKKRLFISIAIITILAFGTVSSAHAFVEPVSLAFLLGTCFLTLVTTAEGIKHTTASAQKQEKPSETQQTKIDRSAPLNPAL